MICQIYSHMKEPDDALVAAMIYSFAIFFYEDTRNGYHITIEHDQEDSEMYFSHICMVDEDWEDKWITEVAFNEAALIISEWFGEFSKNPKEFYQKQVAFYHS